MNCNDLKTEITSVFNRIKAAAPNGNITDEMVLKSQFNELNELAKLHCNVSYSIEWQPGGYILVAAPYP